MALHHVKQNRSVVCPYIERDFCIWATDHGPIGGGGHWLRGPDGRFLVVDVGRFFFTHPLEILVHIIHAPFGVSVYELGKKLLRIFPGRFNQEDEIKPATNVRAAKCERPGGSACQAPPAKKAVCSGT